ncbi:MAG: GEVED domain-containing protein [Eubacteriaceae bacterium]|nr:GEVED domain-containing protein [Eubacteriaceae bacterium]
MPIQIKGTVFEDINRNGRLAQNHDASGYLEVGVPNVYISLSNGVVFAKTITDRNGAYAFSVNEPGEYTVYEQVADSQVGAIPERFPQPEGFSVSYGSRKVKINVTQRMLSLQKVVEGINFSHTRAGNEIPCTNHMIQFAYDVTKPFGSEWLNINLVSGAVETYLQELNPRAAVNGMGYNILDGYIYGVTNGRKLVRVDNEGNVTELPWPEGLYSYDYRTGDIDEDGFYYVYSGTTLYTIDLRPDSPTYLKLVDPLTHIEKTGPYGTTMTANPNAIDWVFDNRQKCLFAVQSSTAIVYKIELNGQVAALPTIVPPEHVNDGFGGQAMDANGVLFAVGNNSGNIYRYKIDNSVDPPVAVGEYFSKTISVGSNDAAFCPFAKVDVSFGEAPDSGDGIGPRNYRTRLSSNGPRHLIVEGLSLGNEAIAQFDANPNADGIETGGSGNALPSGTPLLQIGSTSYTVNCKVKNETGEDANLYGWVDFNQSGTFDVNEIATEIVHSQQGIQTVVLNFNIPPEEVPEQEGETYLRLRLTTDNLMDLGRVDGEDDRSFGSASDGEVEDYKIRIGNAPMSLNDTIAQIISSIAFEELALSHILNAQGEKLQYVLGTLNPANGLQDYPTIETIKELNGSVREMVSTVSMSQMFLLGKLNLAVSGMTKPEPIMESNGV